MCSDRIGFRPELLDPLVHHLRIAQRTERAEELARGFTHCRPRGVRINLFHCRGYRAASANGHTEIVHGVHIRGRADAFQFFQDLLHPKR
jgi:hypothetical protein